MPYDKPWKCEICSEVCARLDIPGSLMYNVELSNPTGVYGQGVMHVTESVPRTFTTTLDYSRRKMVNKIGLDRVYIPEKVVEPICRTCYDMCEAVSNPSREAIGERGISIRSYFIDARTEEYMKKNNIKWEGD